MDDNEKDQRPLYLATALKHSNGLTPGSVVLSARLSSWILISLCFFFALSIFLFLIFGDYTRRVRVAGQVQLSHKVAHVVSGVTGTILKKYIIEGQIVKEGDPLYLIDADKNSLNNGQTQEAISADLSYQMRQLEADKQRQREIFREETERIDKDVANTKAQLSSTLSQLEILRQKYSIDSVSLSRYTQLHDAGYLSDVQHEQRQQDNLELKAKIAGLVRDLQQEKSSLAQYLADQKTIPLKTKNELSSFDEKISNLNAQLALSESRRQVVVRSQIQGKATALLHDPGESVTDSTLLLSILPEDAIYVVDLYAPSSAIGFIHIGSTIAIRYEAFPYEKFGQYEGHVIEISGTTTTAELLQPDALPRQLYYRVRVELKQPWITAYGERISLQDGMNVDSDILLENRKLFEWMLEPLYAITGRYGRG